MRCEAGDWVMGSHRHWAFIGGGILCIVSAFIAGHGWAFCWTVLEWRLA